MPPQRFRPNTTKYRLNSDGSLYIFRFWPVAALLTFITCFFVIGLQQRADVPRYHQDCAAPWLSANQPLPTQPCLYKAATVYLTTHHDSGARGSGDGQTAEITYPDNSTVSMSVGAMDGKEDGTHDIPAREVDGSCWVETWQGKVTAVLNTHHRLISSENPEARAPTIFSWFLMLALLFMTVIVGLRIQLLGIRETTQK